MTKNPDTRDFTTTIQVEQPPKAAFAAINDPRRWWSEEIEGETARLGGTFEYHFKELHRCTVQVVELVPDEKVVWLVLDNHFSFTTDETEWKGTRIRFDISRKEGRTEVRFTHQGLVPTYECYEACSEGWSTYVKGSLKALIATGRGRPNVGHAVTASERVLDRSPPR